MKFTTNFDLKNIAFSNRKSIRRAIARFCIKNNIDLSQNSFETIVRRTQESGYESTIKFFTEYFTYKGNYTRKQLLYKLTIEYNMEMHARTFPKSNKVIFNILNGIHNPEDERFFKDYLYDIVKANSLQLEIINKYA